MIAQLTERAILLALRTYQTVLSPVFSGACRFYPTCSAYASEAVTRHGVQQGLWLAFKRLLRCRPFHPGGYDPVPDGSPGPLPGMRIGLKSHTPLGLDKAEAQETAGD
jgi:putative membrane protein insertion efficiency factor